MCRGMSRWIARAGSSGRAQWQGGSSSKSWRRRRPEARRGEKIALRTVRKRAGPLPEPGSEAIPKTREG